jgi:phospholipase C
MPGSVKKQLFMKFGALKPSAFLASITTALFFAETVLSVQGFTQPAADEFPWELRQKIKYVIIIYPENRSLDSLFGSFPGANGLKQAAEENSLQVQPNGTPFATLPPPNTNSIPGISNGPDPRFPAVTSNAPFDISPNVPITDRHGDLIHRFYTSSTRLTMRIIPCPRAELIRRAAEERR